MKNKLRSIKADFELLENKLPKRVSSTEYNTHIIISPLTNGDFKIESHLHRLILSPNEVEFLYNYLKTEIFNED